MALVEYKVSCVHTLEEDRNDREKQSLCNRSTFIVHRFSGMKEQQFDCLGETLFASLVFKVASSKQATSYVCNQEITATGSAFRWSGCLGSFHIQVFKFVYKTRSRRPRLRKHNGELFAILIYDKTNIFEIGQVYHKSWTVKSGYFSLHLGLFLRHTKLWSMQYAI